MNKELIVECGCGDIRTVNQSNYRKSRACQGCLMIEEGKQLAGAMPTAQPNEFLRAMESVA